MRNLRIKFFLLIFASVLFSQDIEAQCACMNCPYMSVSNSVVTDTINISGATNPDLGVNGQSLKQVCLDFVTDAVDEVDITIIAPNGSSVLLIANSGISSGQNILFDICFNQCGDPVNPEPGFNEYFDSSENWQEDSQYCGSFYPSSATPGGGPGCLEELTGPVNGDWVLEIEDFIGLDDVNMFNWVLVFEDNAGLNCPVFMNCVPDICLAEAGILSEPNLQACVGDPSLIFGVSPVFNTNPEPDPILYGDTLVIVDAQTDIIIEYVESVDMTSFPVGEYLVCNFSFRLDMVPLIAPPDGVFTYTNLFDQISASAFCGDLSGNCISVIISDIPDPVIIGPTTVCIDQLFTYSIDNPDPTTTYSFNIIQGGFSQFISNPTSVDIALNSGPAILCVDGSNNCGNGSTCIDIEVVTNNTVVSITGPELVCPGSQSSYTISPPLNTDESFSFNITDGFVINQTNDNITVFWSSTATDQTKLCVGINSPGCIIPETCLDVTFIDYNEPPISSPDVLCEGEPGVTSVLEDPSFINYLWTLTNLIETSPNGSSQIEYLPAGTGTATICLEIEDICAIQEPICQDIEVLPIPSVFATPPPPSCELDFLLSSEVEAGSNVTWTQISGPSTVVIDEINSPITPATASQPGIYTFQLDATISICAAEPIFVEVIISPEPEVIDVIYDCVANQEYTVEIIIDGTPPFSINGVNVNSNTYLTDPIPSEEFYSYEIIDAIGCSTLVEGTFECNCIAESGTMSSETLFGCAEEVSFVQGEYLGGDVPDSDDVGYYVLHDSPTETLGNIIEYNQTGLFEYSGMIIPNNIYYISYVVGNFINGEPDFEDPCLVASIGQPVIFRPIPGPIYNDLPDPANFCEECANIVLSEFYENVIVNVISGDAGTFFIGGTNTITICANQPGTVELEYEIFQMGCSLLDTISVDFSFNFSLSINSELCTDELDGYIADIDIAGGVGPYESNVEGTFDGMNFISETLETDSLYLIEITDALGCVQQIESGPINCACDNEVGELMNDEFTLCQSDSLYLNLISNNDYVIIPGIDTIAFAIYENNTDNLSDYLYISYDETDKVSLADGFNPDQFYYIKLLVGPFLSTPDFGMDYESSCLLSSPAIPLIWYSDSDLEFDINEVLCTEIDVFSWDQNFDGPLPFTIVLDDNQGNPVSIEVTDSTQTISLPVNEGIRNWVIQSFNGICGFSTSGNITIEGISPVDINLIEQDSICNSSDFGSELVLSDLLSDSSQDGTWYLDDVVLTNNTIDFDGFSEGSYEIKFSTEGFEEPCSGSLDSIDIYVKSCLCPQVNVNDTLKVCSSELTVNLANGINSVQLGTYDILNPNNLSSPPVFTDAQNIDISSASEGNYIISFTLENMWPVECELEFFSILTIENLIDPGTVNDNPTFCILDSEIDLNDYVDNITLGGNWTLNNNSITNIFNLSNLVEGNNLFTYSFPPSGICPAPSIELVIAGQQDNIFTINDLVVCDSDLTINAFDLINSSLEGSFEIINSNNLDNPPVLTFDDFIDISNSKEGSYTILFSANNQNPENCTWTANAELTIENLKETGTQSVTPTLCKSDTPLDLFELLNGADEGGNWYYQGNAIINPIIPTDYPSGEIIFEYEFEATLACPGNLVEVIIILQEEIEFEIEDTTICNTQSILNPELLISSDFEGVYTISNPSNLQNPPFLENGNIITENSSAGEYILSFEITEIPPDNCVILAQATLTIENQASSGIFVDDQKYCSDEELTIVLSNILEDEDSGGTWSLNGVAVADQININDLQVGLNYFNYEIISANSCEDVNTEAIIEIIPTPSVTTNTMDVLCFGDENGIIEIEIISDNFGPYTCTLNENQSVDKIVENLPPGNYTVTVINNENCSTVIDDLIIGEPQVIEVSLGDDIEANFNDVITIEALINLVQSDVSEISWEDLTGILDNEGLNLTQEVIQNNSISITIIDENGCIGTDQILIRLLENEISLSNIIVPGSSTEENRKFGIPDISVVEMVDDFRIYDRWGNKVFEAKNFEAGDPNGFWDATFNSVPVTQGVYSYYMKISLVTGEEKVLIGDVTVIR